MKKIVLAAIATLGVFGQAYAQGSLSETDKAFLMKDSRGGHYELESAKLAAERASEPRVKSYAKMLVKDHENYNAALERLGKQEGVTLPTKLDEADMAKLTELKKLQGKKFDESYIKEAVAVNASDKRDAEKEAESTQSTAIKSFIQQFAAIDAKHEQMAKELQASMN